MSDGTGANPCLDCGACCASFRVSFYWTEAASAGGTVPDELIEPLPPHRVCMAGTHSNTPRCIALEGTVGQPVRCRIYAERSSTCREFRWHGEDGQPSEICTRARAIHGLPPLPFGEKAPATAPAAEQASADQNL